MNSATFTIIPEDLIAANRLHFIKLFSIRRWLLTFIGSAVSIALIFYGFDLRIGVVGYLVALGSMWAIIVAICGLGWPWYPANRDGLGRKPKSCGLKQTSSGMLKRSLSNQFVVSLACRGQPIIVGPRMIEASCSTRTSERSTPCRSATFRRTHEMKLSAS